MRQKCRPNKSKTANPVLRQRGPQPNSTGADYVAMFPTRLALARWMQGGDIPHVFSSTARSLRAAWYARPAA
jgi:hypothetical protein